MPKVSIVMPTYNQADFIEESLNSIFQQTYDDYEVVVINDGSTDATGSVLARYVDRIRYFAVAKGGQAAARNIGIGKCSGELIAFLDSDDLWTPDKLEKQVARMDLHPEIGMTHADYVRIDASGTRVGDRVHSQSNPPSSLSDLVRKYNTIGLLTAMVRKSWLERVGGFDARLSLAEDLDLWVRLAHYGCPFGYIDEVLGFWRRHQASISRSSTGLHMSHIHIFENLLDSLGSTEADGEIRPMVRQRVVREKASLCREHIKRGERTEARDLALGLLGENQAGVMALLLLIEGLLPFRVRHPLVFGRKR